jgi:hypothetical protein
MQMWWKVGTINCSLTFMDGNAIVCGVDLRDCEGISNLACKESGIAPSSSFLYGRVIKAHLPQKITIFATSF